MYMKKPIKMLSKGQKRDNHGAISWIYRVEIYIEQFWTFVFDATF